MPKTFKIDRWMPVCTESMSVAVERHNIWNKNLQKSHCNGAGFRLYECTKKDWRTRCGSRIWSRGGPKLLRPKVADIAKRSRASEVSILWPGSRARLRALEAFGFLMLKYAFSHILETLFLLFLTSILTPKVDKNRALDFTSINLRHSDMLHLFFNLHEKVML